VAEIRIRHQPFDLGPFGTGKGECVRYALLVIVQFSRIVLELGALLDQRPGEELGLRRVSGRLCSSSRR
jgi:hypothetical protein